MIKRDLKDKAGTVIGAASTVIWASWEAVTPFASVTEYENVNCLEAFGISRTITSGYDTGRVAGPRNEMKLCL